MKKLILFFTVTFFAFVTHGQNKINKLVESYSSTKLLKNSTWSLYAKYLDNSEVIIDLNSSKSVAPASGLKVFTSSFALNELGSDFQFHTYVFYDGEILNGELNGNIYIVGGGDPTLGSTQVEGSLSMEKLFDKWYQKISNLGIRKINGSINADELNFDGNDLPDQWNWIDIGNYYGASSPALTIHDNLYYLFFETSSKVGRKTKLIRTEPEIEGLTFVNHIKSGKKNSGDNGYVYCAPHSFKAELRGTLPAGENEFSIKGSIPDPGLFAVQAFKKYLIDKQIPVEKRVAKLSEKISYDKNKMIDDHLSPKLKDIIYIINKKSNNLYTELILKAVTLAKDGIGSTLRGIELMEKFLSENNIDTDALILYDGSGLSRENSITAKLMVDLLSLNTRKIYFDDFYNSLGIVGDSNDISFFTNSGLGTSLEKNARIKSGSIVGVRSYSGYLKDKSGRTIVFSMIANNFKGSGTEVNKIHLKLMEELANLK